MVDWFLPAIGDGTPITTQHLVERLLAAFAFGVIAAVIHSLTAPKMRPSDRSFLATLVMLAMLIAVVTIVIGTNVARAFSLAGVLAIIRFRTVVEDTRDTAFVIFAVVSGMAVGSGFFREAIIVTPMFALAAWLFRTSGNLKTASHAVLIIRYAAGKAMDDQLLSVINKYIKSHRLIGLSTARNGSAHDISYNIQLPIPEKVHSLITDLTCIDGVQGVEVKDIR